MTSVRHVDSCTALPYGTLVTRIVQHARVATDGMVELALKKGPITAQYLNASNAHLRDAASAPRPQQRRTVRADGASTSASQEEWLGRIKATLQTFGQVKQSLTKTIPEL
jgi:methylmalonyl-CoA mutase N-terminal domain/subunit